MTQFALASFRTASYCQMGGGDEVEVIQSDTLVDWDTFEIK